VSTVCCATAAAGANRAEASRRARIGDELAADRGADRGADELRERRWGMTSTPGWMGWMDWTECAVKGRATRSESVLSAASASRAVRAV
jgi:hypothetical protein